MTRRRVIVGPDAEDDMKRIDAWWSANRSAAPQLFLQELQHAIGLIADVPFVGKAHRHRAVPGLRRYLLRDSKYHVYYLFTGRDVVIVAVWGAIRGVTPRFNERRRRLPDQS